MCLYLCVGKCHPKQNSSSLCLLSFSRHGATVAVRHSPKMCLAHPSLKLDVVNAVGFVARIAVVGIDAGSKTNQQQVQLSGRLLD